ncbi:MAG: PilZ domain-containing protein [Dongiaceae bacterium]
MTDEPPKPSNERRGEDRRTALKSAQIVFNDHKSIMTCRIRNISETGARLEFPTAQLLPHSFELQVPGAPVRLCMLRWAKGNLAGVWFVS